MNKKVLTQARRLLDRLQTDFELHHRRKGAVDRRSGHYRGWFRSLLDRSPERLTAYQLLSSAEGLGLDPVEQLAEAIEPGPRELLQNAREATHGKRDRHPAAIQKLHATARRVIRHRTDAIPRPKLPAPSRQDARSSLLHGPLDLRRRDLKQSPRWRSLVAVRRAARAIDDLRYRAPWDAGELAEILTLEVAGRLKGSAGVEAFTRAAAVLGSSHRIAGSMEGAAYYLETALEVGRWTPGRVRGELLQRAGTALFSFGDYKDALALYQRAAAMYDKENDRVGLARTWVDRTPVLCLLGHPEAAVQNARLALSILPDSERGNRGAAYQALLNLYQESGDLEQAEENLQLAIAVVPKDAAHSRGMVRWSAAAIAWRREQLDDAEHHLLAAVEGLAGINPFDTALASLDLCELLLAGSRPAEAMERARGLAALLEPFRANQIAAAALLKLTCLARRGAIDLAAVESARRAVTGGRRQGIRPPAWH